MLRRGILLTLLVFFAGAPGAAVAASSEVAALQVAMKAVGRYDGGIDGISGPATRAAVWGFQARRGLAADGVAGPRTRARLGRRGRPRLGSRAMRAGNRGWDVAALQFLLTARGFGTRGVDGGYGPATIAAVRRFQRAAGLAADDVAGPRTLGALRRRTVTAPTGRTVAAGTPGGPVAFLRPVRAPITDGFGFVGGRRHTGLDFPAASGAPVGSSGRGVVTFAGYNRGGYGNLVVVTHRLGYETWYAHLSQIAVGVGQPTVGGTRIGLVGSTGRSTGPHLHYEVRRFGTPIDPRSRLLIATAARAGGKVRQLSCAPNADARATADGDPWRARLGRCP